MSYGLNHNFRHIFGTWNTTSKTTTPANACECWQYSIWCLNHHCKQENSGTVANFTFEVTFATRGARCHEIIPLVVLHDLFPELLRIEEPRGQGKAVFLPVTKGIVGPKRCICQANLTWTCRPFHFREQRMMKVSDSGLQNTNNSGVRHASWLCSKVSDQVRSGVADKGHTFNHDWIDCWGKKLQKSSPWKPWNNVQPNHSSWSLKNQLSENQLKRF